MAETLGLPTASILSWARSGLLSPQRDPRGFFVFSFQDIALLRTARDLVASDVSPRRVRRALESLREQLPAGRPLSAVQLDALGGQVLVRDGERTWEPDTGQIHLALDEGPGQAAGPGVRETSRFPGPRLESARADDAPTADALYESALNLEAEDAGQAKRVYREALARDPGHADAHLNLGRLLHEEGDIVQAERHYRSAAAADPGNSRSHYNLGVALEDQGRAAAAVEAYGSALEVDPDLGAAHFNLSRLFEAAERPEDALRHLAAYKRILDRGGVGG